jgi:hypothetical protein
VWAVLTQALSSRLSFLPAAPGTLDRDYPAAKVTRLRQTG